MNGRKKYKLNSKILLIELETNSLKKVTITANSHERIKNCSFLLKRTLKF